MKYEKIIVMYDIKENKKRNKIMEICKYYGLTRIQYSVYGGVISSNNEKNMTAELKKEKLEEEDTIRILNLCERCLKKMKTIGNEKEWEKQLKIRII